MSELIDRINAFISKRIHVTEDEAERMGIHTAKPKSTVRDIPVEKPTPKVKPVVRKPIVSSSPRSILTRPTTLTDEVAGQLTPKGKYTTAADIAQDVRDSKRLAHRIVGQ
jgi:hypothetical protein